MRFFLIGRVFLEGWVFYVIFYMEESIGLRIRWLRQRESKGQLPVAVALDLSVPAYSKIETGKTDISVSRLFQIADYFGVGTDYLLHGDPSESKLALENAELKEQLGVVNEYCILLQRRLIEWYEEVEGMKGKVG